MEDNRRPLLLGESEERSMWQEEYEKLNQNLRTLIEPIVDSLITGRIILFYNKLVEDGQIQHVGGKLPSSD